MSQVVFDTLGFVDELKKSGISQKEAEGIARASSKAFGQMVDARELATKRDLDCLRVEIIKWLLGVGVGLFIALAALFLTAPAWLRPLHQA